MVAAQATGVWRALRRDRSILVLLLAIVVVDTVYRQLFATLPLLLRGAAIAVAVITVGKCSTSRLLLRMWPTRLQKA